MDERVMVLVVEDDPDLGDLLRELLESFLGLRTVLATDGRQALRQVDRRKPDLILLDFCLPGLTGAEVAKRLKSNALTRTIPILAMSASVEAQVTRSVGCDEFISKPFELDTLLSKVKRLLPGHG